jgi:hypothetical protein
VVLGSLCWVLVHQGRKPKGFCKVGKVDASAYVPTMLPSAEEVGVEGSGMGDGDGVGVGVEEAAGMGAGMGAKLCTKYDHVLIGGDLGTLYTAALLSKNGHKCVVLQPTLSPLLEVGFTTFTSHFLSFYILRLICTYMHVHTYTYIYTRTHIPSPSSHTHTHPPSTLIHKNHLHLPSNCPSHMCVNTPSNHSPNVTLSDTPRGRALPCACDERMHRQDREIPGMCMYVCMYVCVCVCM